MNSHFLEYRRTAVLFTVLLFILTSCSRTDQNSDVQQGVALESTEPTSSASTITPAPSENVVDRSFSEPLQGTIGSSSQWGSGWLDLSSMTDFQRGDRLFLKIGGTAEKIIVRLLTQGTDPNSSSGIDGGIVDIPENRQVEIMLQSNHSNVIQISVHGGANPWGLYSLGGGNGPAKLLGAEHVYQK